MKIVKQGDIPEYNFTCKTCGCEFIARLNECGRFETNDMRGDRIYLNLNVRCPCCDYEVKQIISK